MSGQNKRKQRAAARACERRMQQRRAIQKAEEARLGRSLSLREKERLR